MYFIQQSYREAPLKRGTFFKMEVYEKPWILRVRVRVKARIGKTVIWEFKRVCKINCPKKGRIGFRGLMSGMMNLC